MQVDRMSEYRKWAVPLGGTNEEDQSSWADRQTVGQPSAPLGIERVPHDERGAPGCSGMRKRRAIADQLRTNVRDRMRGLTKRKEQEGIRINRLGKHRNHNRMHKNE